MAFHFNFIQHSLADAEPLNNNGISNITLYLLSSIGASSSSFGYTVIDAPASNASSGILMLCINIFNFE